MRIRHAVVAHAGVVICRCRGMLNLIFQRNEAIGQFFNIPGKASVVRPYFSDKLHTLYSGHVSLADD
jgi:hypothetical protein